MRLGMVGLFALVLAPGCKAFEALQGPQDQCERTKVWYPDEDGDGIGDEGAIYIGCDEPEGWVLTPPIGVDDTDTSDTDAPTDVPTDTDPPTDAPSDTDPPTDTDAGSM